MNLIKRYTTLGSSIVFAASLCVSAQAAPVGVLHNMKAVPRGATIGRPGIRAGFQPNGVGAITGNPAFQEFCKHVVRDITRPPANPIAASSGVIMACFGRQYNDGTGTNASRSRPGYRTFVQKALTTGGNVDAANTNEDISPNGVQNYGQAETSIAAIDKNVVEAWNDSTAFTAACGSPSYKEEVTGFGLSTDGGRSFTDLGGLPNPTCAVTRFLGDPSVEAYKAPNGIDYFYITNLFSDSQGNFSIALDACSVQSSIPTCNGPFLVATGSFMSLGGFQFSATILDKDFSTIDPARARLYVSYTRINEKLTFPPFSFTSSTNIELAGCDLTNPGAPACTGTPAAGTASTPIAVLNNNTGSCAEDGGAYPAVDRVTGDVYVAYQHNWVTDVFGCQETDTERVVQVPFSCLPTVSAASTCTLGSGITATQVAIASMDAAFIPGYNRFPANSFPRIAVSDPYGVVSIVWNDTRYRPSGDIYLQSFLLGAGFPQASQQGGFPPPNGPKPVRLSNNTTPTFNYMPALRYSEPDGRLDVTWTDRRRCNYFYNPSLTDIYGAFEVNPRTTAVPANTRITNLPSSWLGSSSDIVPNYGDYTDNYVQQSGTGPSYLAPKNFVAWTDARLGEPQPFEAYVTGI